VISGIFGCKEEWGGTQEFAMQEKSAQFSTVAKWCHWLVVFFLASMMSEAFEFKWKLPEDRGAAVAVHVSVGMIVLVITFFRLAWRKAHPPPQSPSSTPELLKRGAKIGHLILYALFLGLAVLGLWMAAMSPVDVRIFSGFNISALAPANPELLAILRPIHFAGSIAFTLAIAGHVFFALWHHFKLKDDVLVRMLPFSAMTQKIMAKGKTPLWRFPNSNNVDWGQKATWFRVNK
jgi:cytochrome b561